MKKRILLLFIILTMVVSSLINVPVFAQSNEMYKYEVLSGLGIIPKDMEYSGEKLITRGEFARMTAYLIGYDGEAVTESYFEDLEKNYYETGAINYLYHAGIVSGYSDRTFRAGQNITYGDAIGMLMKVMGFGEKSGIFINSYFPKHNRKSETAYMTHSEAYGYLYEALETKVCTVMYNSGGEVKYIESEKNVLQEWRKISKTEGVVSSVGFKSMTGDSSQYEFSVGNTNLRTDNPEDFDCLGFYCEVYYDDDDKVIYAHKVNGKNNTITIDADNAKYKNGVLTYWEGNAERNVKVSAKDFIVKNFKAVYAKNMDEVFNISQGEIKINRIAGHDTTVILIEEYKDYLVSEINETEKILYCGQGDVRLDRDGLNIISDDSGNKVDFKDIKSKNVISVAQSEGDRDKVTKVIVSTKKVTGVLETVKKEKITVDMVEYPVSESLIKELSAKRGQQFTFYFNYAGEVVAFDTDSSDEFKYGYLCKVAKKDTGFEKESLIKIFTQDRKMEGFVADDNIKIDKTKCRTYSEIMTALARSTEPDSSYQLIRYKMKGDGVIGEIDTEYLNIAEGEDEYSLQPIYKCFDENHNRIEEGHLNDGLVLHSSSYENLVSVDASTLTFKVPATYSDNERVYSLITASSGWIDAYTANPDKIVAEALVGYSASEINSTSTFLGVIEDACQTLNADEENVYQLTLSGYLMNKQDYTLSVTCNLQNLRIPTANEYIENYVPQVGDAIQCSLNDNGEIINIVPYYSQELSKWLQSRPGTGYPDYSSGNSYYGTNDNTENATVTRGRFHIGYMYKKYNNLIQIALGDDITKMNLDDRAGLELVSGEIIANTRILKLNQRGEIAEATKADLRTYSSVGNDCSKVLLITYNNDLGLVLIMEQEMAI